MHLSEAEFIDHLEGVLEPARAAHAATCAACTAQLQTVRAALASLDGPPVGPPSPLFWQTFPDRVRRAIDEPARGGWWVGWRGFAAGACGILLVIALATAYGVRDRFRSAPATPVVTTVPASDAPLADDIDQDAAWAVVRVAADDLGYEDALAEGISPSPETWEGLAMELSEAERAELVRLIQGELKRTGA